VRRELKVWGRLKHDCILPLWGVASNFGPYPAMVCPWLDNGTLTGFLERQEDILSSRDKFSIVSLFFASIQMRADKCQLNDVALGLQYRKSSITLPEFS
jgi:hypothetical protein